MPVKVKRGLGLVLVALIAWAVGAILLANDAPNLAALLPVAVMLGCGVTGLVLIAWGLLRE